MDISRSEFCLSIPVLDILSDLKPGFPKFMQPSRPHRAFVEEQGWKDFTPDVCFPMMMIVLPTPGRDIINSSFGFHSFVIVEAQIFQVQKWLICRKLSLHGMEDGVMLEPNIIEYIGWDEHSNILKVTINDCGYLCHILLIPPTTMGEEDKVKLIYLIGTIFNLIEASQLVNTSAIAATTPVPMLSGGSLIIPARLLTLAFGPLGSRLWLSTAEAFIEEQYDGGRFRTHYPMMVVTDLWHQCNYALTEVTFCEDPKSITFTRLPATDTLPLGVIQSVRWEQDAERIRISFDEGYPDFGTFLLLSPPKMDKEGRDKLYSLFKSILDLDKDGIARKSNPFEEITAKILEMINNGASSSSAVEADFNIGH